MNRHERRRKAKLGDVVEIKLGRVVFDIKPGEPIPDTMRRMQADCFFGSTAEMALASAALIERGFDVEPIDDGSLASIQVKITTELDDDQFYSWVESIIKPFDPDCVIEDRLMPKDEPEVAQSKRRRLRRLQKPDGGQPR